MQSSETELATLRARLAEAEKAVAPAALLTLRRDSDPSADDCLSVACWHLTPDEVRAARAFLTEREKEGSASAAQVMETVRARAFIAQGEGKGEPDSRAPIGSDQLVVHASNSPTRGCTLEVDNQRKEVMPDAAPKPIQPGASPHATPPQPVEPPAGAVTVESLDEMQFGRVLHKRPTPPPDYRAIVPVLMEALLIVAGRRQCMDNLMGNRDVAEAALAAARAAGIGGE